MVKARSFRSILFPLLGLGGTGGGFFRVRLRNVTLLSGMSDAFGPDEETPSFFLTEADLLSSDLLLDDDGFAFGAFAPEFRDIVLET